MNDNFEQMHDCVVYARYSSHAQRDVSIEQQVADIEIFCQQNNYRIVHVYADRHMSGTNDRRPEFQKMIMDAAHSTWKYIITWKVDRFARDRYDSAVYKNKLKKYGVRVISAKEYVPEGPTGIILESMLEGMAEYYSANLAQNVRRGMIYNAQQCKVNSGAMIPYGYSKGPDGCMVISEAEAEIAREIFDKVAQGVSFVDIAKSLNERKIPARTGGKWNRGSFHHMLTNEAYIGVYKYAEVRVEGGVPAIIDKNLFLEVAKKLKNKKNPQGRHRENGDYMLTGKLFCGLCGTPMVGVSGTGKHGELHYYYACKNHRSGDCKKKNVARDWIEQVTADATLNNILQDDVVEWLIERIKVYQTEAENTVQLDALRARLDEAEKGINNMLNAIQAGIITPSTKKRLDDLEAEAAEIRDAIALEQASIAKIDEGYIRFWMNKFRTGNRNDPVFRRDVIDTYVSAAYLWDDRIRIVYNFTGAEFNETNIAIVMDDGDMVRETGSPDALLVSHPGVEPGTT